MKKVRCKIPTLCSTSCLIGTTVASLREAGLKKEMKDFINSIKRKDINLDYSTVFQLAERYIDFD